MNEWTKILDCCPGLLCCVINAKGKLLYASLGYKNIAARLFGHTCKEGGNYPPMITDFDKTLHDVLMLACLGKPSAIEFIVAALHTDSEDFHRGNLILFLLIVEHC